MDSPLLLHQPSYEDEDDYYDDSTENDDEKIVYVPETPPPPAPKKTKKEVYVKANDTIIPTRLQFESIEVDNDTNKKEESHHLYGEALRSLLQAERDARIDLDWDESYTRLRLKRRRRDDREFQELEVRHRERRFREWDHDILQMDKHKMRKLGNDKANAIEV